jgi:hypothetical protein
MISAWWTRRSIRPNFARFRGKLLIFLHPVLFCSHKYFLIFILTSPRGRRPGVRRRPEDGHRPAPPQSARPGRVPVPAATMSAALSPPVRRLCDWHRQRRRSAAARSAALPFVLRLAMAKNEQAHCSDRALAFGRRHFVWSRRGEKGAGGAGRTVGPVHHRLSLPVLALALCAKGLATGGAARGDDDLHHDGGISQAATPAPMSTPSAKTMTAITSFAGLPNTGRRVSHSTSSMRGRLLV